MLRTRPLQPCTVSLGHAPVLDEGGAALYWYPPFPSISWRRRHCFAVVPQSPRCLKERVGGNRHVDHGIDAEWGAALDFHKRMYMYGRSSMSRPRRRAVARHPSVPVDIARVLAPLPSEELMTAPGTTGMCSDVHGSTEYSVPTIRCKDLVLWSYVYMYGVACDACSAPRKTSPVRSTN